MIETKKVDTSILFLHFILFLIIIAIYFRYIRKFEIKDSRYLDKIRTTALSDKKTDCSRFIDYLTSMPTWRFSILSSLLYTSMLFIFFYLIGYEMDRKMIGMFWILLIGNVIFVQKLLDYRNFHYIKYGVVDTSIWENF